MTKNGADLLAQTLAENGIDTCFANPGTTEMHLVAAFGRETRMATHLCVFEGVATGAADGFARMAGRPAVTLLHLGPGLANGMANLHNAKKAATPIVNIVGEHATHHLGLQAPLTADIEAMAATVSESVITATSADTIGADTAELLSDLTGPGAGVGTLVVPNDVAWTTTETSAPRMQHKPKPLHDPAMVGPAARALQAGPGSLLLLGAAFITKRSAELAHAIERKTGCLVLAEAAVARMERGGGTPPLKRLPFHVDPATDLLKQVRVAVLAGARAPVAFFAYPGRASELLPDETEILALSPPLGELEVALEALAAELGARPVKYTSADVPNTDPQAPIAPDTLGAAVARTLPDRAIVVDESITNGGFLFTLCGEGKSHDWLNNRGGSIGYSMPVSIGAAVACPDRKVLCITGDGSALYTLQSLWTMARSKLDVTVVILANRSYRILANEMSKIGAGTPTDTTTPLLSLENPQLDWVQLANGHGVDAEQVSNSAELEAALQRAFSRGGPRLIEAVM